MTTKEALAAVEALCRQVEANRHTIAGRLEGIEKSSDELEQRLSDIEREMRSGQQEMMTLLQEVISKTASETGRPRHGQAESSTPQHEPQETGPSHRRKIPPECASNLRWTDDSTEELTLEISLHVGANILQMMKVEGRLKGRTASILADMGSTHNFIGEKTAKVCGCKILQQSEFQVAVGNGNSLWCKEHCPKEEIEIQGQQFVEELFP
ncbi:hypothetical protein EJ110_NYTH33708 [Nymphaea thermarum]|nr:hypothetical protein EJ110_NYTH33708 [Nymphaea thermarum]